jgi:RNA polymerase-binding transcription factor DksA
MEYFKTKLEGERKILIQELKNLGTLNPKTGQWAATPDKDDIGFAEADEIDRADHSEDFQERTSTLNTLEKRLKEIDRALEKIRKNNYGKCEVCSKEIETDRLEANSAASTCKEHMR